MFLESYVLQYCRRVLFNFHNAKKCAMLLCVDETRTSKIWIKGQRAWRLLRHICKHYMKRGNKMQSWEEASFVQLQMRMTSQTAVIVLSACGRLNITYVGCIRTTCKYTQVWSIEFAINFHSVLAMNCWTNFVARSTSWALGWRNYHGTRFNIDSKVSRPVSLFIMQPMRHAIMSHWSECVWLKDSLIACR